MYEAVNLWTGDVSKIDGGVVRPHGPRLGPHASVLYLVRPATVDLAPRHSTPAAVPAIPLKTDDEGEPIKTEHLGQTSPPPMTTTISDNKRTSVPASVFHQVLCPCWCRSQSSS